MADTLTFLVGPMDDYSPMDYQPLAEQTLWRSAAARVI